MNDEYGRQCHVKLLEDAMSNIAERSPMLAAMLARLFVREPAFAREYLLLAPVQRFVLSAPKKLSLNCTLEELYAIADVTAKLYRARMRWANTKTDHDLLHWMEYDLNQIEVRIRSILLDEGESIRVGHLRFIREFISRLYVHAFEEEKAEAPQPTKKRKQVVAWRR